mmetsp:Transcript_35663/g.117357  ORF Transcript_35663/g.117357 Transcript_35663/m.117357 type:complete len:292 (+) Transcript_35663:664-1539(+)
MRRPGCCAELLGWLGGRGRAGGQADARVEAARPRRLALHRRRVRARRARRCFGRPRRVDGPRVRASRHRPRLRLGAKHPPAGLRQRELRRGPSARAERVGEPRRRRRRLRAGRRRGRRALLAARRRVGGRHQGGDRGGAGDARGAARRGGGGAGRPVLGGSLAVQPPSRPRPVCRRRAAAAARGACEAPALQLAAPLPRHAADLVGVPAQPAGAPRARAAHRVALPLPGRKGALLALPGRQHEADPAAGAAVRVAGAGRVDGAEREPRRLRARDGAHHRRRARGGRVRVRA